MPTKKILRRILFGSKSKKKKQLYIAKRRKKKPDLFDDDDNNEDSEVDANISLASVRRNADAEIDDFIRRHANIDDEFDLTSIFLGKQFDVPVDALTTQEILIAYGQAYRAFLLTVNAAITTAIKKALPIAGSVRYTRAGHIRRNTGLLANTTYVNVSAGTTAGHIKVLVSSKAPYARHSMALKRIQQRGEIERAVAKAAAGRGVQLKSVSVKYRL